MVVLEALVGLPELMCDTYGNYLCQQLFQACSAELRQRILERLMPFLAHISMDRRGTHSLQSLVGVITTRDEEQLLERGLADLVFKLAMDPHGTHVIQRVLVCFAASSAEFIHQKVIDVLDVLAQNPSGLCVVKKCIVQANESQRRRLLAKLADHTIALVQSPYGNYAIQTALEQWGGMPCKPIILKLKGSMLQLAIQKFSSNVVEKCLAQAEPRDLQIALIDELLGADRLQVLMDSQYGAYAAQTCTKYASKQQLQKMQTGILRNHSRNARCRKHKWDKLVQQIQAAIWERDMNDPGGVDAAVRDAVPRANGKGAAKGFGKGFMM
jgi:hypothetical protein